MGWSDYAKGIADEIGMCLTYEEGQECRGTGGRKMRRVCVHCPNYERWRQRKGKEETNNGNEGKNDH